MRRILLWAGVAGVTACGGNAVPETGATDGPERGVAVEAVTMRVPLVLPAQLYVEHDAFVYARSLGIVNSVRADVGDRVRAGQLLAELENADQRIALDDAESGHDFAARTAERYRALAGTGVVARADSEAAERVLVEATLRLRQARRDYELTRITAPFAGVVAQRRVRRGQLVDALDSLFRVTALGPLLASVLLPERAGLVAPGDTAVVVTGAGDTVAARVSRVAPTIDAASGAREVILRVPDRPGLRPGMSVDVRLGGAARPVLAIPADYLLEDRYVLVWEDGRSVLRPVTPGTRLADGRLEVLDGLAAGERVVRRP